MKLILASCIGWYFKTKTPEKAVWYEKSPKPKKFTIFISTDLWRRRGSSLPVASHLERFKKIIEKKKRKEKQPLNSELLSISLFTLLASHTFMQDFRSFYSFSYRIKGRIHYIENALKKNLHNKSLWLNQPVGPELSNKMCFRQTFKLPKMQ